MPTFARKRNAPQGGERVGQGPQGRHDSKHTPAPSLVHPLGRTIGNQGVIRLLQSNVEGVPTDLPATSVVEFAAGNAEEGSRARLPARARTAKEIEALDGHGHPLPEAARAFFEPRFGADFGRVRVHTDTRAAATASSIRAKAFTFGNNIAFGAGRYAPSSGDGQRLLAHELAHVVQQNGPRMPRTRSRAATPSHPLPAPAALHAKTDPDAQRSGADARVFRVNPGRSPGAASSYGEVDSRRRDDPGQRRETPLDDLYSRKVSAGTIMRSPDLEATLRALHRLPSDAYEAIEERRLRLLAEFESLPPADAATWYGRLVRRDPTDADAQMLYDRFQLLHTVVRDEMMAILDRKIDEQIGILRRRMVGLYVAAEAPVESLWEFASNFRGFRMNPAYWNIRFSVEIQDNPDADENFSNQQTEEASVAAVSHLNAVVGASRYTFTMTISIAPGADAASAIQDVWDSAGRYAIDCRLAANLIELKGIHAAYVRNSSTAAFNRDYRSFRYATVERGVGRFPARATTSLHESLRTERGLEEFVSHPVALNENGVDTDFDEYLEPGMLLYFDNTEYLESPWAQENAVYLGNNRFFGHPLGPYTPRGYVHHLRTRRDVQDSLRRNRRFPDEDNELMQHLYVVAVARPRALPESLPSSGD